MKTKTTRPSVKKAAQAYLRAGFAPVPIPSRKKGPVLRNWPKLRLKAPDVDRYFGEGANVGLLVGEPSRGLIDIDLDSPETILIADAFLPPTRMVHGRESKPSSHRWYRVVKSPASVKFTDVDRKTCLLEVRSTGLQTLVPPSTHPSGEVCRWEKNGAPAAVDTSELLSCTRLVAAGALISRLWPTRGSRHDAALALAGMLLRAGWPLEQTMAFLDVVARAAGDEEWQQRATGAKSTQDRLGAGGTATGATRLREILGDAVVAQAQEWLDLPQDSLTGPMGSFLPISAMPVASSHSIVAGFGTTTARNAGTSGQGSAGKRIRREESSVGPRKRCAPYTGRQPSKQMTGDASCSVLGHGARSLGVG